MVSATVAIPSDAKGFFCIIKPQNNDCYENDNPAIPPFGNRTPTPLYG
jgi:hypothetical protein